MSLLSRVSEILTVIIPRHLLTTALQRIAPYFSFEVLKLMTCLFNMS